MIDFRRSRRSASTPPHSTAAAPATPTAVASGAARSVSGPKYSTMRHRITIDALITSAESSALTAVGAAGWAAGSHECNGNSAVFAAMPTTVSAMIAPTMTVSSARSAACARSTVPVCPYVRATASRKNSEPVTATKR